jgi:hypothetical protein
VDTAQKRVRVPCRVNMSRGMIEYLAVATEGKRHESVLLVEAEPLHIHLALLLLGLEPGPRPRYQGGALTPDPSPNAGGGGKLRLRSPDSPPLRSGEGLGVGASGGLKTAPMVAHSEGREQSSVNARVMWRAQGRDHAVRLEELAWDIPARRPMEPVAWVFTGVAPPRSGPRTTEERSVVATYRDPDAVLNNPLPTGADDTVYKVNERLVPPVGTPVTLWLSPTAAGG